MPLAIEAPIKILTPPKRYKPVGHCIYCGVYTSNLTKEHIIAHGLAGDSLILPKASCGECAKKTRDWETACLRHLWWPLRTRTGMPRSGKQDPTSFTVRQMKVTEIHNDGSIEAYDKTVETIVGPMEFPLVFLAYKFPPPAVLVGREPGAQVDYEVMARINEEEFRKYAPGDKDGFRIAPMNPDAYARMLAKIAHAYAVAELGESAFWPKLRRFIRGRPMKALQWIGGDLAVPKPEHRLHDIQWRIQRTGPTNYLVVSLRLFSFIGSPQYHVVVGELARPLDQLPFLEQPLYTIDIQAPVPIPKLVPIEDRLGGTWN